MGFCKSGFLHFISPGRSANNARKLYFWDVALEGELTLAYAKVQAEDHAKYYINSSIAQPIHTDEGHTTKYPRYVALYCFKQSLSGGCSIAVPLARLLTSLISQFGEEVCKLLYENAITVDNVNGREQKSILLKLEENDIGISYSPVLQRMWCSDQVFQMFDFITSYVHNPENQIRFKLDDGHILLIDNCRALHGRTAFPKNDERLFYRYWFGNEAL